MTNDYNRGTFGKKKYLYSIPFEVGTYIIHRSDSTNRCDGVLDLCKVAVTQFRVVNNISRAAPTSIVLSVLTLY